MGGYSELIKNLSKTRDYLRDFFIYGCKYRNDFTKKSARTYDDEKRRISSWLGDLIRHDDSVSGRMVSVSVNSGHVHSNPLYKAYYSRSFTDKSIWMHFCLLDVLSEGRWLTVDEIELRLFDMLDEDSELPTKQTIRNKLREYISEGIILKKRIDKADKYCLSPDRISDLLKKFTGLDDALRYFSCSGEFGVVGDMIMKDADIENDCFLIRHNYIIHTLEDEIVLRFIDAIEEKCVAELTRFSDADKNAAQKVVPLQILTSLQTGRRYIAVWDIEFQRFTSMRLDYIKDVSLGEHYAGYDKLYDEYTETAAHSFGVSFQVHDEEVKPLRIVIRADEEKEKFIINRIIREKRCGKAERIEKNTFAVTFDVNDPYEIMQWVKSLTGRIISIDGGTQKLRDRFSDDIRRMAEMYGGEA